MTSPLIYLDDHAITRDEVLLRARRAALQVSRGMSMCVLPAVALGMMLEICTCCMGFSPPFPKQCWLACRQPVQTLSRSSPASICCMLVCAMQAA